MNRRATRRPVAKVKERKPGTGLPEYNVKVKLFIPRVEESVASVTYPIRAKSPQHAVAEARLKAKAELAGWGHTVDSVIQSKGLGK